ncbi:MAG: SMC-Scp complex subunit ScpB [Porticoccaceae bacterium]|jgi:segregation and condensation protein B|nr:SMC-Scp complex subunit ScpB [Porticoccaceae bacterium]
MSQDPEQLRRIIEGALLAAGRPLDLRQLQQLFDPLHQPDADRLRAALDAIAEGSAGHAWELRHTASGYRLQVRAEFAPWVSRLWEEKPRRYSRALLETLALIAYRQPVTRGDIEAVRGVAVSSETIRTLLEREWIRVVGHRDVPGRPALYATTRQFLDYFNLSSLDQLPPLGELRELDFSEGLELTPGGSAQASEPEEAPAAPSTAP